MRKQWEVKVRSDEGEEQGADQQREQVVKMKK
jgi:hypothetical protein